MTGIFTPAYSVSKRTGSDGPVAQTGRSAEAVRGRLEQIGVEECGGLPEPSKPGWQSCWSWPRCWPPVSWRAWRSPGWAMRYTPTRRPSIPRRPRGTCGAARERWRGDARRRGAAGAGRCLPGLDPARKGRRAGAVGAVPATERVGDGIGAGSLEGVDRVLVTFEPKRRSATPSGPPALTVPIVSRSAQALGLTWPCPGH